MEDAYLEKLSSNDAGEEFMISSRVGMAITETELVDILNAEGYEFEREEIAGGVRYAIKLDGAEANNYCTIKFADGVVQYITISAGEDSLRE